MPAVTYLSDHEVREWATVKDDKDCNELLQEFRTATGRNWIIQVMQRTAWQPWWKNLLGKAPERWRHYTLYNDCHGEWQVMNLVTHAGGSNFYASKDSRAHVMNYMLGYIGGLQERKQ